MEQIHTWEALRRLPSIRINLGGYADCHPQPDYAGYVSVDRDANGEWAIRHDLDEPLPLDDDSVDRILSEHAFEHLERDTIRTVLAECHRVLKPGGLLRIAVPDYQHPKNRKYLRRGDDPTHTDHLTLTTYPVMRSLLEESPFSSWRFYHYWDQGRFHEEPIDYSLGHVKRTPDHDPRCRRTGLARQATGLLRDLAFILSRGGFVTPLRLRCERGHRLRMTSIVVDARKQ